MAIRLKPIDKIVSKYVQRASGAGGDYRDGVQNPRRPQAETAIAAASTYEQAIQASIADKRFEKGVRAAGEEKWQRKAVSVGQQRYPQGVTAAQADFQSGVAASLETIAALTLPPRFPKGDPRNIERVNAVAQALRKKKLGG